MRKWFPLLVLLLTGIFILYALWGIITIVLGACILYVLARPPMLYLTKNWRLPKSISAILIILLSFVLILGPLYLISTMLYQRLNALAQDVSVHQALVRLNEVLQRYLGTDMLVKDNILAAQRELTNFMALLLSQTFVALGSIAVMYLVLYYLLVNSGQTESRLRAWLPLSDQVLHDLKQELNKQVYSNALGAPFLALVQGLTASLCYYFFGLKDPLFWGMVSGIFSFIPFVGSALIWFPVAVMKFLNAEPFNAWMILICGALLISSVDNLLRLVLQKKIADIHPLVTLFGIIGGVKLFGLPGLIFGPLLLSYFFILLKLFKANYLKEETAEEIRN
ncbi:MAG TPA: AI-2E family transporter [Bacteroidia bacterium]|nr:AI-2E family transporter [Bacteroidia bacterium]